MFKHILCAVLALVAVQATGDFVVLHSPNSVNFDGDEVMDHSVMKEVFTAALGFTPKEKGTWSGISISNPFTLPEAVVGIAVEGVHSLKSPRGKWFPLNDDEIEEYTWQTLSGRLEERDTDNTLVRIYLGDGLDALGQSALGELKPATIDETSLKALDVKIDEDREFLEEVQLLLAIAEKVPSTIHADSKPDVYWFIVSKLPQVLELHGAESAAAKEAFARLNDAISEVSKAFMDAYDNQVLIAAFTNDAASQVRHTRSVNLIRETRDTNVSVDDLNLSKEYSEHYPVIFNIMLWFGVAFVFSLIAICIAIADMDPGRDSIIYRMTSNRMKKDN